MVEKYAAANPENAALQLDLAIGLYRLAYYLDDDVQERRDRARAIVQKLTADGKVTPAQKAFMESLEQWLANKPT
jgi:hypothetical protein